VREREEEGFEGDKRLSIFPILLIFLSFPISL
jgi:hypothetical protein